MSDGATQEECAWFKAERSRTVVALVRTAEGGRVRYVVLSLAPLLAPWAMWIVSIAAKQDFDFEGFGVAVAVIAITVGIAKAVWNRWDRIQEDIAKLSSAEPERERMVHCARNRSDPDQHLLRLIWAGCCVTGFVCILIPDADAGAMGLMLAICSGVIAGWSGYRALASRPPRTLVERPSALEELLVPLLMFWVSITAVNATAGTLEWSVHWYIDPL